MTKLSLCLMIVFFASCDEVNTVEKNADNKIDQYDEDYLKVVEPNNSVAFSLLEKVDPDENNNVLISPTSALIALFIAYNGAEGETKEEIEKALQLHDVSMEDVNKANAALMKTLTKDMDAIELFLANSIWLNDNYQFMGTFTEKVLDDYDAKIAEIDITDDSSVERINQWVSDNTHGKIEEIVEAPLHSAMVTLFVNALYFNGKWTHEFDEEYTEEQTFFTLEADKIVPFMQLEAKLAYMENDLFQAIQLPYGKGEMHMNVLLPLENMDLEDISEELSAESWEDWQTQFEKMDGTLKLPKFQIEYETVLNEAFQQLGIQTAFDKDRADFPHIIVEEEPLWIHEIKQKTFIDVNEKGTEGAAATSVEMETTSAMLDDTFYMEVNRPFLFTITDEETGAILFIGKISNPE